MTHRVHLEQRWKRAQRLRRVGVYVSGRACLDCGEPLFGPEMLHARSLPGPPDNVVDAIRYAGVMLVAEALRDVRDA